MSYVAPTTPAVGDLITAAQAGVIAADIVFLATGRPLARLRQAVVQSIPNATFTAVTWDAEDFDTAGGHDNVTNNSRYTCQVAGYYRVFARQQIAANATGRRIIKLTVNGVDTPTGATERAAVTAGAGTTVDTTEIVVLAVGDYVEAWVFQNSGGALNTAVSTPSAPSMTVEWMRS